ncbi:unnamed protein product [Owenia fusiformis]|uniref:Solute carrier organic anion transporter family member n=1 Tax=Owenia fusiformis TaxID=6347 RepID=A0A8J1XSK9_OWEFU|nr:unnamed protein product [Owenia fusiformis]
MPEKNGKAKDEFYEGGKYEPTENKPMLDDEDDVSINRADYTCGLGPLKPKGLQRFANIKLYLVFFNVMAVLVGVEIMFRFADLTTLEKRFGFKTTQSGIIISSFEMGHVFLVIMFSYFGGSSHKPKMLFMGGVILAVSAFVWALPHFLFGSGRDENILGEMAESNNTNIDSGLCEDGAEWRLEACANIAEADKGPDMGGQNNAAYGILLASELLLGVSLAPYLSLGIAYIDENCDPISSAFYVGIAYSIGNFGTVIGFLLAGVFLTMDINLTATDLTPVDPGWLGAWWLGSLLLAVIAFVANVPMFMFPKKLPRSEEEMKEIAKQEAATANIYTIRNFPRLMARLFRNGIFVGASLGMAGVCYIISGCYTFLPKYIETQFGQTASLANILTAVISAFAMSSGCFFGGWVAGRFKLTPYGSIKLLFVTDIISIAGLISLIFVGCPQVEIGGTLGPEGLIDVTQDCNSNCSCGMGYNPVCGENGMNYLTPCHAGCDFGELLEDGLSMVYSNCSCINGLTATSGWCETGCNTMLIVYSIILFVCSFATFTAVSPALSIMLRCVDDELKSLALGVNAALMSLLSMLPAPMIYGVLIDTNCFLWEESCDGEGFCILYNMSAFRQLLHGATAAVQSSSLLFYGLAWYKMRGMTWEEDEDPYEPVSNGDAVGDTIKKEWIDLRTQQKVVGDKLADNKREEVERLNGFEKAGHPSPVWLHQVKSIDASHRHSSEA